MGVWGALFSEIFRQRLPGCLIFTEKLHTEHCTQAVICSILNLAWPSGGMADALDSKSSAQKACGFKSHLGHLSRKSGIFSFSAREKRISSEPLQHQVPFYYPPRSSEAQHGTERHEQPAQDVDTCPLHFWRKSDPKFPGWAGDVSVADPSYHLLWPSTSADGIRLDAFGSLDRPPSYHHLLRLR